MLQEVKAGSDPAFAGADLVLVCRLHETLSSVAVSPELVLSLPEGSFPIALPKELFL